MARNPLDVPRTRSAHDSAGADVAASRRVRGRLWRKVASGAGLSCLALSVLAGCGDEAASGSGSSGGVAPSDASRIASANKSKSTSSTTSSPSSETPTGSQSPKQYTVPEAAKAHTHEGAKAFVKFYWETLGDLDANPQTGVLPRFAAATCQSCKDQEEAIGRLAREGAHIETKKSALSATRVRPDSVADSVVVQFNESFSGRMKVVGGKRTSLKDISQETAMRADWNGNSWVLGEAGAR